MVTIYLTSAEYNRLTRMGRLERKSFLVSGTYIIERDDEGQYKALTRAFYKQQQQPRKEDTLVTTSYPVKVELKSPKGTERN